MRIIANTGLIYIPEWNKNKKESEPIRIHYRYLTGPEYDRFIGIGPIEFDEDGKPLGGFKFKLDKEGMVRCGVEKIENFYVGDISITTADQLCDVPEAAPVYREFIEFYMEANREPDKKKLK
jgi:hypothetical protein